MSHRLKLSAFYFLNELVFRQFPNVTYTVDLQTPLKKARNFYKLLCDISSMTLTLQKYCKNTIPVQQTTFITSNGFSV